ncbi:MAG: VOC family protein [Candidatus Paceibacterota bacterium]|jgi:hypothetical protein
MGNRVVHFEIQADDVSRAKTFYEKTLGWQIDPMMTKDQGGMDYWGVVTGDAEAGINGGLYQRPAKKEDMFYLYDCTVLVSDLDKTMEAVRKNGGIIIKEKSEIPHVGWFASAKDTEGNRFGLMEATEWRPA